MATANITALNNANANNKENYLDVASKQKRLKAALSYDGIAESEMYLHLAKVLNVSKPIAKRMLAGNHRTILNRGIDTAYALNVSVSWLYFGELGRFSDIDQKNRTLRIHMQSYKGYSKELTDKAMRFNFAFIAGMKKAQNLMNLFETNRMSYIEAVTAF
ncbi:MAG: hypothetical protein Q8Q76_03940 [Methylotenera sp.]|nr:hypothetical protein [Methylotenera sp.]